MSNERLQQSKLWQLSRDLIGFNTVSTASNVEAISYLAHLLEEIGFTVHVLTETVQDVQKAMVLAWAGPERPGGLILSGHTDIVPFEGQPGWLSDPLVLRTDGQRIFGRGTTDMKIFLAQAILAATRYPLAQLKRPLMFIFTCDEELAGQGAERLVRLMPDLFRDYPLPTVALIGEPTNFEVFPAHKGYASFDIFIQGKGGHSSAPQHGLNAIEKMADVIMLLKEIDRHLATQATAENQRLFPESPSSIFNCGIIQGGLAANMIAETCRLTVSIRVAPGDQVSDLLTLVQKRIAHELLPAMQSSVPDSNITFEHMIATPALRSPTDSAFCDLLCRVMNRRAERGAPYATDGGQFQQIGINSYICGPGLLEEAHQPNESIPVSHFLSGQEKLEQLIYAWCIDEYAARL